jgi:hypothetical protein
MGDFGDIFEKTIVESGLPDKTGHVTSISTALILGVNTIMIVGFGLGFVSMVYAFILYIMSNGDPKNIQKARDTLFWSIIAIFISVAILVLKGALLNALDVTTPEIVNAPTF